jgi:GTP diphosphokinase / guanosine-3',5'-bis(diphosphate) 3'-diphosphatase
VNGKMAKLTYEIKDGDTIEVKTQKNRVKPSGDWLKIAQTSKARAHIRKALKM